MNENLILKEDTIINRIYMIRGMKVMLDKDLAEMYGVETRVLNQAVKRNIKRFPEDFMFQLTENEHQNLMSQNVISSWGGRRTFPYVFTEHGVLMLSSVLNSQKAIEVNIQIMRIFIRMRSALLENQALINKIEQIEQQTTQNSEDIQYVFRVVKELIHKKAEPRKRIGFK
jgi:uncharacterized membrane-anchored protein YjiN (DUF445 family)